MQEYRIWSLAKGQDLLLCRNTRPVPPFVDEGLLYLFGLLRKCIQKSSTLVVYLCNPFSTWKFCFSDILWEEAGLRLAVCLNIAGATTLPWRRSTGTVVICKALFGECELVQVCCKSSCVYSNEFYVWVQCGFRHCQTSCMYFHETHAWMQCDIKVLMAAALSSGCRCLCMHPHVQYHLRSLTCTLLSNKLQF